MRRRGLARSPSCGILFAMGDAVYRADDTVPRPDEVFLAVEGEVDREIVSDLLEAGGFPVGRVRWMIGRSKRGAAQELVQLSTLAPARCAILVDMDDWGLPDARARAREQLGDPPFEVFCAVPATEAWLFADPHVVLANAVSSEEVRRIVQRLPLPEEIPDPKQLALQVFGPMSRWRFLRHVDLDRAAARSPSLRVFLDGMARLLGIPREPGLEGATRSLSRDVIASLLREVSPKDAVIWRTLSGDEYTASELQRLIEEGDEVGRQYSSDLLRIARDFLHRTANRKRSE